MQVATCSHNVYGYSCSRLWNLFGSSGENKFANMLECCHWPFDSGLHSTGKNFKILKLRPVRAISSIIVKSSSYANQNNTKAFLAPVDLWRTNLNLGCVFRRMMTNLVKVFPFPFYSWLLTRRLLALQLMGEDGATDKGGKFPGNSVQTKITPRQKARVVWITKSSCLVVGRASERYSRLWRFITIELYGTFSVYRMRTLPFRRSSRTGWQSCLLSIQVTCLVTIMATSKHPLTLTCAAIVASFV